MNKTRKGRPGAARAPAESPDVEDLRTSNVIIGSSDLVNAFALLRLDDYRRTCGFECSIRRT